MNSSRNFFTVLVFALGVVIMPMVSFSHEGPSLATCEAPVSSDLTVEMNQILQAMSANPQQGFHLAEKCGIEPGRATLALTRLRLEKRIQVAHPHGTNFELLSPLYHFYFIAEVK